MGCHREGCTTPTEAKAHPTPTPWSLWSCAGGRDPGYLLLLFLCLAGVLGSWIGSFKAPFRWMILSWITSRMFLIHSCLVSMLEAWSATGRDSKNLISLQSTETVLNPSLAGLIHHWSRIPNVGGVYFSGFIRVTSTPQTCFSNSLNRALTSRLNANFYRVIFKVFNNFGGTDQHWYLPLLDQGLTLQLLDSGEVWRPLLTGGARRGCLEAAAIYQMDMQTWIYWSNLNILISNLDISPTPIWLHRLVLIESVPGFCLVNLLIEGTAITPWISHLSSWKSVQVLLSHVRQQLCWQFRVNKCEASSGLAHFCLGDGHFPEKHRTARCTTCRICPH